MSLPAYDLGLWGYRMAMLLARPWVPKARRALDGRKGLLDRIEAAFQRETRPVIWMHCASLGEFEQGRPVLEQLRQDLPDHAFLLTFFSPSGYEVRKNYEGADYVFYLPFDTPANAEQFLAHTRPVIALFVKYDLWYHYLHGLAQRGIPILLFAARFRERRGFFQAYSGLQVRMLRMLSAIEVQDEDSQAWLRRRKIQLPVRVSGDPRFDRVAAAAYSATEIPGLERFRKDHRLLIAGSTWPADEKLLAVVYPEVSASWKLVLVPHEVDEAHLQQVARQFPQGLARWSKGNFSEARILLVDTVGMLLALYRYADIAYVGGGFGRAGIHNVLEPAAMGAPVLFGPVHQAFPEAAALQQAGGAAVVADAETLLAQLRHWMGEEAVRQQAAQKAQAFVQACTGATKMIVETAHRLLRNR